MNNDIKQDIKDLMNHFPSSFINSEMELILMPRSNTYFLLEGIETKRDLIASLLMWTSRTIAKHSRRIHREMNRANLNYYLKTSFTQEDIDLIYQKLGNGINVELTYQFIDSGFDLEVLR